MTTDDRPRTIRDGLVPLGPEDTYNGVKVSSFCMACRDQFARYEHGMQASVELCAVDSVKVFQGMSSVHVAGGGSADDFRKANEALGIAEVTPGEDAPTDAAFGAFEVKLPAPAHPAPWRWTDERGDLQLVAADHRAWTDEEDGHDNVLLSDRILCIPREMSPYVREVVRAAPEIEALLRWFVAQVGDIRPAHPNVAKAIDLLARIDAAKGT